jgi:glucosamine--fructose-6-phosphate aminotransferase (isomerizing)
MDQGDTPRAAAMKTIKRLTGAFALVFLFEGQDDLLIATRKGSPLAIGYGDGENYVGSDAIALAPLTDQITYIEEGDTAIITRNTIEIVDETGAVVSREIKVIHIDSARIDKGGHKHYMAKEIAEQPVVVGEALRYYMSDDGQSIVLPQNLAGESLDFTQIDRMTIVACGTAYIAGLTAKYWFEQIAGIPVEVDIASEFRYREPPITARTVALFVSQSGETSDTLAALRYCAGKADKIVSVVNVPESSIARESDLSLPILAGTEIGVASTKAFTCQLSVLLLLALKAAADRGRITAEELADHLSSLRALPAIMTTALGDHSATQRIAGKLSASKDVLFLGRGLMFPLAREGALKLKELSYIHAEAYASGESKHGPIALIDKSMPVVVLAPRDALFDKTVSNMQEVMARKGKVILITDATGAAEASEGTWDVLIMPDVDPILSPILYSLPAQLLAYYTAVAKGTDVDQPRNLAKSVTVE